MALTLFDQLMTQEGFRWQQAHDPHYSPEARCEAFWKSHDGGDTELEYLGLLHWIVRCVKPAMVLETGTANGLGTLAIASALEANGHGRLTTLDIGKSQQARELVRRSSLGDRVTFVQSDALEFCAKTDDSFDFGFFDSVVERRWAEIQMLLHRGRLSGLAAIHDTGATRFGGGLNGGLRSELKALRGIEFPLGRGLMLVTVTL